MVKAGKQSKGEKRIVRRTPGEAIKFVLGESTSSFVNTESLIVSELFPGKRGGLNWSMPSATWRFLSIGWILLRWSRPKGPTHPSRRYCEGWVNRERGRFLALRTNSGR